MDEYAWSIAEAIRRRSVRATDVAERAYERAEAAVDAGAAVQLAGAREVAARARAIDRAIRTDGIAGSVAGVPVLFCGGPSELPAHTGAVVIGTAASPRDALACGVPLVVGRWHCDDAPDRTRSLVAWSGAGILQSASGSGVNVLARTTRDVARLLDAILGSPTGTQAGRLEAATTMRTRRPGVPNHGSPGLPLPASAYSAAARTLDAFDRSLSGPGAGVPAADELMRALRLRAQARRALFEGLPEPGVRSVPVAPAEPLVAAARLSGLPTLTFLWPSRSGQSSGSDHDPPSMDVFVSTEHAESWLFEAAGSAEEARRQAAAWSGAANRHGHPSNGPGGILAQFRPDALGPAHPVVSRH